jgi:hypothetical protein
MEHPSLWETMSRHAREHALLHYDSRLLVEAQVEWYRKVVAAAGERTV